MSYHPASYASYPPQMVTAPVPGAFYQQPPPPGSYQNFPPPPFPQAPPMQQLPHPQYAPQPPQQAGLPPPSFRITKDAITNLQTNQKILTLTRKSQYSLSSSKPSLTISRPDTSTLGTVKFSSLSESKIEVTINNQASKLKNEGMLVRDKWAFQPIFRAAVTTTGEKWYWIMESGSKTGVLQDQKKDGGNVIARLDDGWFVIERPGLSNTEFEEILVTGIAVAEKGRKDSKDNEEAEGVMEVVSALAGG